MRNEHLVLNKKQLALINSVTIVSKKFSEVYGSFSGAVQPISSGYSCIYVSYGQIMYS